MPNTTTTNCHPLKIILDRNEAAEKRASAMLAMICSNPKSRSNHRDLTVADVEVSDSPAEGVAVFVETQDMETFLHVVSVVTREAAMTGYAVQINQHGWGVGFIFTEWAEPEVETEWVVVCSVASSVYYYSESPTAPGGWAWTPLREHATAFGSRVDAQNYLDAVFPVSRPSYTHVREAEVAKWPTGL